MSDKLHDLKEKLNKDYADQFKNYLTCFVEEKISAGNAERLDLDTKDKTELYRKKIKADFCGAVAGIDYDVMPLSLKESGLKIYRQFSVSNLLIEAKKNYYITANFYKPLDVKNPPAILFLCGHAIEAKTAGNYIRACSTFAANGFAVLAVDTMGQGERCGYAGGRKIKPGIFEHSYNGAKAWLTGVPLNHYFVDDYMTALNYLYSRKDIDNQNIGVTGSSGGGTATSMMALSQTPKIKAFAPAAYITEYGRLFKEYEAQDDEQIFYGLTGKGFNYDDIVLAALPRPFCILTQLYDFFPAEGAIDTYLKAKRFYEMYGAADNLELTIDNAVHGYSLNSIYCAVKFFAKHLTGNPIKAVIEPEELPVKSSLIVTKSGMIASDFADARFVQHEISDLYNSFKRAGDFNNISVIKSYLNRVVFEHRKLAGFATDKTGVAEAGGFLVEFYTYNLHKSLHGNMCIYSDKDNPAKGKYLLYFTDNGNLDVECDYTCLKPYTDKGYSVVVFDPINYGYLKGENHSKHYTDFYATFGAQYNFAHQMFFAGDSMCAFKIFEAAALIEHMKKLGGSIEICAKGKIEIPVVLAVLITGDKIPCSFANKHEDYEDIILTEDYDDYDIKSYILPGLSKYCNIKYVKQYLSSGDKID